MKTLKIMLAVLMALAVSVAIAQKSRITVSGVVTDDANQPLTGVTVQNLTDKNFVAMTDVNGKYSITAAAGDRLQFSFVGYEPVVHKVKTATLHVAMTPEIAMMDECVVVGYGDAKQSQLTGRAAGVAVKERAPKVRAEMLMVVSNDMACFAESGYYPGSEEYAKIKENRFINVAKDPLSTFALEVDGASYSNTRRMINQGQLPDRDAVRVEEFINYFSYDYAKPAGKDPLKVNYEVGPCPWNTKHKLVRIGIKAREIPSENLPNTNFVFLIDVSGSMYGGNRLPLVISSLKLLVNNLRAEDRVAIVTYAGSSRVALESTSGSDKQKIREVLDGLTASGSTAGGAGIKMAYQIARKNFIQGGNNRIILATDGDFNVGVSSSEGLENLVEQERKSGIFLTVLGYGMGNYKDKKMQVLAEKGNGNYAYIDNLQEANKVLVGEFGGTMHTVAKDVKLQVEFNPSRVASFRLVGYESRLLEHEDFNDDAKDAGEVGVGHTVTALYEIVPVGSDSNAGSVDPLKYQPAKVTFASDYGNTSEWMTVKIRYKQPDGDVSTKMEIPVTDKGEKALSEDFRFVSAVAMFAQLLRESDFRGDATYDKVIAEAGAGLGDDPNGYRREFIRLVQTVKSMSDRK
ncbi:von Willebrand factor type A domain-containing protein [uncultured Alistipes sp.]|jgi:hypothetical protein|uniref:vWA domain-containing protein n=1 Tax=uncultured Alistipes sp. TaxID=538949 RepID=UPI0025F7472D|nr:von Willebrand factor type A domain-containing protein [uncultured Alistipes sp.]